MQDKTKKKLISLAAIILLLGTISVVNASSLQAATGHPQISAEYQEKTRKFFEYIRKIRQPIPGSIKQLVSSKNADYLNLGNIDPRATDRRHDDGEMTAHAPN